MRVTITRFLRYIDMEEQNETVVLAQSVSEGIKYEFKKDLLIKPLEPVMIQKEIQVPVVKEGANMDEILEYDEVATEIKEVESNFRKGIVLKVPAGYENEFKIGDEVVYFFRTNVYFDLFKDSLLIKPYDVVAVCVK